jgi:hypothetical protein
MVQEILARYFDIRGYRPATKIPERGYEVGKREPSNINLNDEKEIIVVPEHELHEAPENSNRTLIMNKAKRKSVFTKSQLIILNHVLLVHKKSSRSNKHKRLTGWNKNAYLMNKS